MKIIDKPLSPLWTRIQRIHRNRMANRLHYKKHPEKAYEKSLKQWKKKGELKECPCGCKSMIYGKHKRGHGIKINPKPSNLGSYILGKIGDEHPHWKGGLLFYGNYVNIYRPNHPNSTKEGYVLRHRLIMEKKIGRYLRKDEIVHHIDGNRFNNDPDNLLLVTISSHSKLHHIMRNIKANK